MDEETLEILAGLNAAQPLTQQVDYSQFMNDFQPVLNDPNYFVPQQGLLQDTPVLDTLSDLDVMQQRPPVVMDMLNQYPTLESDFQRSFAVSPDTFNMNVYQPLPYDPAFWESFVNQGGGTTGGGVDLGTAAAIIAGGASLLDGDGDNGSGSSTDSGVNTADITSVTTTFNNDDTIDGGIGTQTVEVTPTVETGILTNTILDNDTTEDGIGTQTEEISPTGSNLLTNTIIGGAGNDIIDDGIGSQTEEIDYITKNDALGVIQSLTDDNIITSDQSASLTDTIEKTNVAFGPALVSGLSQISSIGDNANSVINSTLTRPSGTLSIPTGGGSTFELPIESQGNFPIDEISKLEYTTNLRTAGSIIDAANQQLSNYTQVGLLNSENNYAYDTVAKKWISKTDYDAIANPLKEQIANANTTIQNAIGIETVGEPQGFLDKTFDRIGQGFQDFLNNPISDYIPITGDQVLTGVGTALALDQVMKDAKPSNVTAALAGGTKLATGYSNPFTAPLIAGLTIAEQLAPDPSNKTGFSGFDLGTSTSESFGMEGDKFKQANVDKAKIISEKIGTSINTIASGYGLKTEGDILAETGNRDPLSITFGDQESEQTFNNRLNYSPETGDIINSNDDVSRFYYTGQFGNDGNALADNVIRGTNLLSLKALANDEDTINMKDFRVPIRSSEKAKEKILEQMTIDGVSGIDETTASLLTEAARSGNSATYELLGGTGLLVANTTNEDLFLTDKEVTSLLDKGIFENEEQIDEVLYG